MDGTRHCYTSIFRAPIWLNIHGLIHGLAELGELKWIINSSEILNDVDAGFMKLRGLVFAFYIYINIEYLELYNFEIFANITNLIKNLLQKKVKKEF